MATVRFLVATLVFIPGLCGNTSVAYEIVNRWTATQTDGGGINRGDPITLLWSIVPDGEAYSRSANSQLVDYLDDGWNVPAAERTPNLTNRPWWEVMNSAYAQYSRVSGLRMVYVAEQTSAGGDTGREGDIRIGGEVIDNNPGGVLADNTFPNDGDMRIDTSRDGNGIPSGIHSNVAPLRNLISHESAHGVGLGHSDITGAESVMEGGLQDHFWGLQFDDVYAFNRNYGDPYEKGGNDLASKGTPLGTFTSRGAFSLGTQASDSVVEELDSDWLGIDGTTDEDWFRFTVNQAAVVDLRVTPQGPTYMTNEQGLFNAAAQSDLRFELYSPELSLLRTANQTGVGEAERLASLSILDPGEYYVRVQGAQDRNQFYQLDLDVALPELLLTVDRKTGEATLSALAPGGVDIDGYALKSPSGGLNLGEDAWLSLEDQNVAGWRESNPTNQHLAELLPTGSMHSNTSQTVSLGRLYAPNVTAPFGTIQDDDLTLEYLVPSDEGIPLAGAVAFTGDPFFNNLVLTVDPVTGQATLTNESNTIVSVDGYSITSESSSLDPAAWLSLEDQLLADWNESNPTGRTLSELKPSGGTTLAPMAELQLGQLFNPIGPHDLSFNFLLEGDDLWWNGVVVYASLASPGDYDLDGDVDTDDYVVWKTTFGSTTDPSADGNGDGVVDTADYTVWRDNFAAAPASPAAAQVPEPPSAAAILLACVVFTIPRRVGYSRFVEGRV